MTISASWQVDIGIPDLQHDDVRVRPVGVQFQDRYRARAAFVVEEGGAAGSYREDAV